MQRLFISDLHLSADHPRLVRGFVDLVNTNIGQVNELYILGDWFEAWVGDDDDAVWLDDIVDVLKRWVSAGGSVLVLHGNRDFLLGQAFLDRFGGTLLPEALSLATPSQHVRLEHGDALCTDDLKYQAFRQMSRDPAWQAGMLAQPIEQRRQMAHMMRMQSQMSGANTPANIMDVNGDAVDQVLVGHDLIVHGHTHRPMLHTLAEGKQRLVLGDWREDTGEAVIARQCDHQPIALETWHF